MLLGEACRIVDRLDRLSDALNGRSRDWLTVLDEIQVHFKRDGAQNINVKIAVDGLLSEARQQQLALKTVLAQLSLGKISEKPSDNKSDLQKWLESRANA